MYILQCMRHAVCSESEILFKCRGQYIGGCKLLNRRNTLDIKRSDIHCYHGTKNDGGLLVRRMPVQQQDGVIDYHLFNCIPCLSWKQRSCTKARPTAAETTNICFAKQQPSPHKPQARDRISVQMWPNCISAVLLSNHGIRSASGLFFYFSATLWCEQQYFGAYCGNLQIHISTYFANLQL